MIGKIARLNGSKCEMIREKEIDRCEELEAQLQQMAEGYYKKQLWKTKRGK